MPRRGWEARAGGAEGRFPGSLSSRGWGPLVKGGAGLAADILAAVASVPQRCPPRSRRLLPPHPVHHKQREPCLVISVALAAN